jgi:DNA mismatch repair protein MutS2
LDEIKESVSDGIPVLAVKSAYRKYVSGRFAGTSRSGTIVFIEPSEITGITGRIRSAAIDEQTEVIRILREISLFLKPYAGDLIRLEEFLVFLDIIRAQALFARETGAVLPGISPQKTLYLKRAYHPLLLLENRKKNVPTVPQTLELNEQKRILVISGPNAGGKSITLKTVGLLQLMWQTGMPVPVDPESRMPFFGKILTDIGDNQSIENQLSTYSYRLRNMRLFLRLAGADTLFLIDEFGTGSDPELGGALAEVFLEEFNRKKAFGIITTHYNNLKLLAEKLEGTVNAHMQFDMKTLSPTYRLHIGQAGSSFTFEVAAKMGIPYSLINRAKKKTDKKKVLFDRTLSQMQQKQKELDEEKRKWETESEKLRKQIDSLEEKEFLLLKKLNDFRELYRMDERVRRTGEKAMDLIRKYNRPGRLPDLKKEFYKWIEKEFIKRAGSTENKVASKKTKSTRKQIRKELADPGLKKKLEKAEIRRMEYKPKVGDRVRVAGSKANAVLVALHDNKAVLDYGRFQAEVPVKDLELVMRK